MENERFEALRKRFFPRVPWSETEGPVRRVYLARAVDGSAAEVLAALAAREGFLMPGEEVLSGDGGFCLARMEEKAGGAPVGLLLGTGENAFWCDIALTPPDGNGWQKLIVRSEMGENLTALAYNRGVLRFRRA